MECALRRAPYAVRASANVYAPDPLTLQPYDPLTHPALALIHAYDPPRLISGIECVFEVCEHIATIYHSAMRPG